MASNQDATASAQDTPITIKVVFEGNNRKFKLPLHDLNAGVFAEKIRTILQISQTQPFLLERFSDSGNAYITLDKSNPSAYKQLYRAAKAKLKLRIRASLIHSEADIIPTQSQDSEKQEQAHTGAAVKPLAKASHPCSVDKAEQAVEPQGTIGARDFSCVQARDQFFQQLASISREREMGRRMQEAPAQHSSSFWQIFCNNCDKPMADAHFHCGICDGGDYDLCEACVESGKICPGEGHWLIKRFVKSGKVVTSATETLPPKPRDTAEEKHDIPGAFKTDLKIELPMEPSRTCNACVTVLPESALYTCKDCPDYDLCLPCLEVENGHHPGHRFHPTVSNLSLTGDIAAVCSAGRQLYHHAICDGCDKAIYGIRHKCLNCPDWDFCDNCFQNVKIDHPGHRFAPIYDNLELSTAPRSVHCGILCDGPLCIDKPGKAYIRGLRYKCSICHDIDFCANCEAHPTNKHNESHPMILFKLPVRGAHITVIDETPGRPRAVAGDRPSPSPRLPGRSPSTRSAATLPPYSPPAVVKVEQKSEVKSVASQTQASGQQVKAPSSASLAELDAHFVTDVVADGSRVRIDKIFHQTWTLRNPGPNAWPVGCAVHFVGGDYMLHSIQVVPKDQRAEAVASCSNFTSKVVEPGQTYEFKVWMHAPLRVGKHISYWRLKTPLGLPFGHKLWCDIETILDEGPSTSKLHEFQTQLKALEEQNKRRLKLARLASSLDSMSGSIDATTSAKAMTASVAPVAEQNESLKSIMVFPTLEKESPASSTIMAPVASSSPAVPTSIDSKSNIATETETETETATVASSVPEAEERFEDLESVAYGDSETENDGFLTDEEYDILDASDEEFSNRGRAAI